MPGTSLEGPPQRSGVTDTHSVLPAGQPAGTKLTMVTPTDQRPSFFGKTTIDTILLFIANAVRKSILCRITGCVTFSFQVDSTTDTSSRDQFALVIRTVRKTHRDAEEEFVPQEGLIEERLVFGGPVFLHVGP